MSESYGMSNRLVRTQVEKGYPDVFTSYLQRALDDLAFKVTESGKEIASGPQIRVIYTRTVRDEETQEFITLPATVADYDTLTIHAEVEVR